MGWSNGTGEQDKFITLAAPSVPLGQVCGRYLRMTLSESTGIEGGLRTRGIYKVSREGTPLVSIITVVYNRVSKLERAMKSVFSQSYKNIEYIIIDGGSMDGTLDILKKHENSIDYFISERDTGIYNAMNKGLALATGEYICVLNSDDWLVEDAVEISINEILKSGADYSGADEYCVDEQGNVLFLYGLRHFNNIALVMGNPCNHGTMFISRQSYEKIGYYDESFRIAADLKMQMNLVLDKCLKHCEVKKPIHYYEVDGLSGVNKEVTINEVVRVLREYHSEISEKELRSMILLSFEWQINNQIIKDLESILAKKCYSSEQKHYLLQRMKELGYVESDKVISSLAGIKNVIRNLLPKEMKRLICIWKAKMTKL